MARYRYNRCCKIICLILSISLTLALTGCWDRVELNNVAVVLAAGIDLAPDGNIRLTLQLARPQAFGGKQSGAQANNTWIVSQSGETVMDAVSTLEDIVPREIHWRHTYVLVFGEQMARAGLDNAIDYFFRSTLARETTWVVVARGKAEDVLNSHSQLETTSAQSVGELIDKGTGPRVKLKDLVVLASDQTNTVLPGVELTPSGNPQGQGMLENLPGQTGNSQATTLHAEITLIGAGVFKGDKLVGWLNMTETRGLLWLKSQVQKGEITVNSPAQPGKKISISITRSSTRIKPYYDGQNVRFDVRVRAEGELVEEQSKVKLSDPKVYAALEEGMARRIQSVMGQTLDAAQNRYKEDIAGFGQAFYGNYKKDWATLQNSWDNTFASSDINIDVRADIRRTGLITDPVSKKNDN